MYFDNQVNTREIFTKAICAKGQKYSQSTHIMQPANIPTSILGAWVINHSYTSTKNEGFVEIAGSYDVNVWYSYDNNTKTTVAKELVTYTEEVPLNKIDGNITGDNFEAITSVIQQPNCLEAKIDKEDKCILIKVEKEFYIELVGETKICVLVVESDDKEITEYELYNENDDDNDDDILIDDDN